MKTNAYPTQPPQETVLREGTWQAEERDRFGTSVIIARLAVPTELEQIMAEQPPVPAANPMRYRS